MEDPEAVGFLLTIVQFLRHCTKAIPTAMYYGGILAGILAFPTYAVVVMRRRTRARMEEVLAELATRDPWLQAAARGKGFFETDEPLRWLEDLCDWRKNYEGVRVFFGSPDLEAKCIQVTQALINVFLSWSSELKSLTPARRGRLIELLNRLHTDTPTTETQTLLHALQSQPQPLAWVNALWEEAESINSWDGFLKRAGLATDLSPIDAAEEAQGARETYALALLLYARETYPFREELKVFLRAACAKSHGLIRTLVPAVDSVLRLDGALVQSVRELVTKEAVASRYESHPDFRKFVMAFGESPFVSLGVSPDEDLETVRPKFRQLLAQAQADAQEQKEGAFEKSKILQLAWGAVVYVKQSDPSLPS